MATMRPKQLPPMMVLDSTIDAKAEAIASVQHVLRAMAARLDNDSTAFLTRTVIPLVMRAMPVRWVTSAFEQAALDLADYDPAASDSSVHPLEVLNQVEWWHFEAPTEEYAKRAVKSGALFVPLALLLFTREGLQAIGTDVSAYPHDLFTIIFARRANAHLVFPLGLYAWESTGPVADGLIWSSLSDEEQVGTDLATWGAAFANVGCRWRRTKRAARSEHPISSAGRKRLMRTQPELLAQPRILNLRASEPRRLSDAEHHFVYHHSFERRKHLRHLSDGRVVPVRRAIVNKHLPFRDRPIGGVNIEK